LSNWVIMPYQCSLLWHINMVHIFRSFDCKYKMYTNRIKHDLFNIGLVIIITHWPLCRYVGLWMISRLI
jgi:hypothetical protein